MNDEPEPDDRTPPGSGRPRRDRRGPQERPERPGQAGAASAPPRFSTRDPVGIERAERSPGALPPPSARRSRARRAARPELPPDEVNLPRGVVGEIRRHSTQPDDVLRAVSGAVAALGADEVDRAVELLRWAKDQAPRAPSVRETLAIAHYLGGDFGAALQELNTYRRITGRTDQNHLIADCLRAAGRSVAAVAEAVQEMDAERDGVDRVVEGVIVWGSALADAGDPGAGRSVLERVLAPVTAAVDDEGSTPEHAVRLWYVAGDLAERDGDPGAAVPWFERVAAVDPELYDTEQRLRALIGRTGDG
jgi:hypothetical protein